MVLCSLDLTKANAKVQAGNNEDRTGSAASGLLSLASAAGMNESTPGSAAKEEETSPPLDPDAAAQLYRQVSLAALTPRQLP